MKNIFISLLLFLLVIMFIFPLIFLVLGNFLLYCHIFFTPHFQVVWASRLCPNLLKSGTFLSGGTVRTPRSTAAARRTVATVITILQWTAAQALIHDTARRSVVLCHFESAALPSWLHT